MSGRERSCLRACPVAFEPSSRDDVSSVIIIIISAATIACLSLLAISAITTSVLLSSSSFGPRSAVCPLRLEKEAEREKIAGEQVGKESCCTLLASHLLLFTPFLMTRARDGDDGDDDEGKRVTLPFPP